MIVNREVKITSEVAGVTIFLNKEEATILSYILSRYEVEFMSMKDKLRTSTTVQAHFLSEDLMKEIEYKLWEAKE